MSSLLSELHDVQQCIHATSTATIVFISFASAAIAVIIFASGAAVGWYYVVRVAPVDVKHLSENALEAVAPEPPHRPHHDDAVARGGTQAPQRWQASRMPVLGLTAFASVAPHGHHEHNDREDDLVREVSPQRRRERAATEESHGHDRMSVEAIEVLPKNRTPPRTPPRTPRKTEEESRERHERRSQRASLGSLASVGVDRGVAAPRHDTPDEQAIRPSSSSRHRHQQAEKSSRRKDSPEKKERSRSRAKSSRRRDRSADVDADDARSATETPPRTPDSSRRRSKPRSRGRKEKSLVEDAIVALDALAQVKHKPRGR